jgi:ATPase subunit of ABC transporter with duplicated ATPase domains
VLAAEQLCRPIDPKGSMMLQIEDLTLEVAGQTVAEAVTFSLRSGDKVGLVGRNGAGKTSLLRILSGDEPPAHGRLLRSGELGYLPQDPRVNTDRWARSAVAHIISGRGFDDAAVRLEKLRVAVEENASRANVARFARAEELYRVAGGYSAEGNARRIAAGLGVEGGRLDLPLSVLSGGERRRVELARILFAGSDILLLDEPTNHLDNDAKRWLMKFLRSYKGALLVVSHDLDLLDAAITRILHLGEGTLIEYKGTYSQYRAARARDEQRLARVADRQQSEIKRLKGLADSMRHQTVKRARIAKTLDSRVQRLQSEAVDGPARERTINVRFPQPPRAGDVALRVRRLTKGYGGPPVFDGVDFDLERGERLFVMGLNGAGKTSLLRILAGVTEPDVGEVALGANVSVGYYAQEHEGIIPGVEVLAHMRQSASVPDQQLRSLLGMFGLTGERAFQDAGTLSGGEKTKLALAQLVAGRHNVLLLDEPTNNLDPPSLVAVGRALARWPGTMVIVSHDRDFVASLNPDRVLLMPDGEIDYWSDELLDLVALA